MVTNDDEKPNCIRLAAYCLNYYTYQY